MNRGDGFTIIEVIIFLTISGILLLMAFLGSGEMAKRARFTDTVNSLQSFVQRQYDEVRSGVNTRTAAASCTADARQGADSCLLLGKVLSFKPQTSTITTRTVITTKMDIVDTGTVYSQLAQASPVVSTSAQTNELQWGATIREASRATGVIMTNTSDTLKSSSSRALINAVAFLRGPNSADIITYYFRYDDTNDTPASVQAGLQNAVANFASTAQTTAAICVHNTQDYTSSPVAAIVLGSAGGASGIDTDFNAPVGAAGIC